MIKIRSLFLALVTANMGLFAAEMLSSLGSETWGAATIKWNKQLLRPQHERRIQSFAICKQVCEEMCAKNEKHPKKQIDAWKVACKLVERLGRFSDDDLLLLVALYAKLDLLHRTGLFTDEEKRAVYSLFTTNQKAGGLRLACLLYGLDRTLADTLAYTGRKLAISKQLTLLWVARRSLQQYFGIEDAYFSLITPWDNMWQRDDAYHIQKLCNFFSEESLSRKVDSSSEERMPVSLDINVLQRQVDESEDDYRMRVRPLAMAEWQQVKAQLKTLLDRIDPVA